MNRHYQLYQTTGFFELYEVVSDGTGITLPIEKIMDAPSKEVLKEKLRNMLTDIEKYDTLTEIEDFSIEEDDVMIDYECDVYDIEGY